MDAVEQIARAIHAWGVQRFGVTAEWDRVTENLKAQYHDEARAVLASTPIAGMLEALNLVVDKYDARSELYTNDADCAENIAAVARHALSSFNKGP